MVEIVTLFRKGTENSQWTAVKYEEMSGWGSSRAGDEMTCSRSPAASPSLWPQLEAVLCGPLLFSWKRPRNYLFTTCLLPLNGAQESNLFFWWLFPFLLCTTQQILHATITNMIQKHELSHKEKRFPQFWTRDSGWQIPEVVSAEPFTCISWDFPLQHATSTFRSIVFSPHPDLQSK